jgi:hypothetical protein
MNVKTVVIGVVVLIVLIVAYRIYKIKTAAPAPAQTI